MATGRQEDHLPGPCPGLNIDYRNHSDKMLGNVGPGWAGLHLGWQQGPPSSGSRHS